MNTLPTLLLVALASVACKADHLVVGNVANRAGLAHREKVEYEAIPYIKRVKYFFYSSHGNTLIQGIRALDLLDSKSSINIFAGGVGSSFVNLRMKSECGSGLAYDIGIYEVPYFR